MFERILRNGILVWVAALIVGVLSTLAALRIPVQMIPDLDVRTISVETRWPGATPQDIEKEILIEQEDYLRSVPNLSRMISSAGTGSASKWALGSLRDLSSRAMRRSRTTLRPARAMP